jgi:hypothetical protein
VLLAIHTLMQDADRINPFCRYAIKGNPSGRAARSSGHSGSSSRDAKKP